MTSPSSRRATEPQIRNRPRSTFATLEPALLIVSSTTRTGRVGFLPMSTFPITRPQSAIYIRSSR